MEKKIMEGKSKILLVDDERNLVELTTMRLESAGYEVIAAYDGAEALDKINQSKPDLIILDLMLPKVDGYEVCTMLKQDGRYQNIPIVLLTAKVQEKDEQLGQECGANAYVRKPFQAKELLETIQRLLPGGTGPRTTDPQP
jgi:DNA-binding response OmpR family regulator